MEEKVDGPNMNAGFHKLQRRRLPLKFLEMTSTEFTRVASIVLPLFIFLTKPKLNPSPTQPLFGALVLGRRACGHVLHRLEGKDRARRRLFCGGD